MNDVLQFDLTPPSSPPKLLPSNASFDEIDLTSDESLARVLAN